MDSVELRLLIFTELAGATSQAGFAEIDGVGSTVTRTIFSQSERLAQRATYEAARSENVFTMSTGHNLEYQHSYSPITLRMLKLLIFYSFLHLYFNLKITKNLKNHCRRCHPQLLLARV
jgi:hypothetical protein